MPTQKRKHKQKNTLPPPKRSSSTRSTSTSSSLVKEEAAAEPEPKRIGCNRWIVGMGVPSLLIAITAIAASLLSSRHNTIEQATSHTSNTNPILNDKWEHFNGIATVTSKYQILKQYDTHDPKAFTQGLFYWQGRDWLVESTGMYGESLVRFWNPTTGTIQKEHSLESKYFGEGLCWYRDDEGNDRFLVLTWKEQTAFVYDDNLNLLSSFPYTTHTTEGWGITFDPIEHVFYVTDGSEYIHVWNLQFQEMRRFPVHLKRQRPSDGQIIETPQLKLLNELEWDPSDNTILANIWYQNVIVRIHPISGQVLQIYDLSQLYPNRDSNADVMNGIALHKTPNQLWITGKYWPKLYLIELLE